jgi:hypothetical protein
MPDRTSPQREYTIPDGETLHVYITPLERREGRGVDWRLNAICFVTTEGGWIGSVPLYHNVTLDSLSEEDLVELLDQAIGRG